jgi:hypothetical protein
MVHVSGVDVGAVGEQQIGNAAGAREVQWRLTVAAALVDACGIGLEYPFEQVGAVEVRRGAGVRSRSRGE